MLVWFFDGDKNFGFTCKFSSFLSKIGWNKNFSPHSLLAILLVLSNMCSIEKMVSARQPEVARVNFSPVPSSVRPNFLVLCWLKFRSRLNWSRLLAVGSQLWRNMLHLDTEGLGWMAADIKRSLTMMLAGDSIATEGTAVHCTHALSCSSIHSHSCSGSADKTKENHNIRWSCTRSVLGSGGIDNSGGEVRAITKFAGGGRYKRDRSETFHSSATIVTLTGDRNALLRQASEQHFLGIGEHRRRHASVFRAWCSLLIRKGRRGRGWARAPFLMAVSRRMSSSRRSSNLYVQEAVRDFKTRKKKNVSMETQPLWMGKVSVSCDGPKGKKENEKVKADGSWRWEKESRIYSVHIFTSEISTWLDKNWNLGIVSSSYHSPEMLVISLNELSRPSQCNKVTS